MSSSESAASAASASEPRKTRVMIGLPGSSFTQGFVLSWSQALYHLIHSGQYEVMICPGASSFVSFARMQTLGADVLRGKNQKPFNGADYDVFVSIDSDIVFPSAALLELIEATRIHPVVSGYYMMADNKNFAVVKDWNKEHFLKNGCFPFLTPADLDPYLQRAKEQVDARKKAQEEGTPIHSFVPEFMNVSYAGMGFFACRKEVLDKLSYPFFHRELQRMRASDGTEIVDMCSEDVAFCKNIADAGYDIMLHTQLRVGHEKMVVL